MLAENFYNLFSGLDRAYGRYDLDTDQSGVKRSGTARTIAEKLTLQQWELHLEGKQGLGVVPIRDDAKVLWGAIDIDEYDLDVDTLSKSLGTPPFIPCLTKSGGIHLYVFFKKATSAKLVVNKLREITSALGKPSAEIFPKQIKLVTDRGDVGNWINMPYFGGNRTTRYAIYNGEHITNPEDFLKLADIRKIDSVDEIKIPQLKEQDKKLLPDGPPCLKYLLQHGIPEGTRNNSLYNVGVYLKKAHPDEWEEKIEEYNHKYIEPPLKSKEVQTIIKSLEKKEYNYMCSEQPINAFCNKPVCLTCKFGISDHGNLPAISGITKINTDPPTYFVTVNDHRIGPIDSLEIINQKNFQRVVFENMNTLMPIVAQPLWLETINELMEKMEIVEVNSDSSNRGRLLELCERFCTGSTSSDIIEDLLRGHAVTQDNLTMFRINDFMEFLEKHRFKEFKLHEVTAHLKEFGAEHLTKKIKGKHVNLWSMAKFERQEEEFTKPEIKTEDEEIVF